MSDTDDQPAGEAVLRLDPGSALWREVGDEVVIFGVDRSEYLAANAAGALLWPLLAEGATLDRLAGALSAQWGLGAGQARADAEAFVAGLREQGLLEA